MSKHALNVGPDLLSDAHPHYQIQAGKHRRVVLTKPVSLTKRVVPNADTLVRSYPTVNMRHRRVVSKWRDEVTVSDLRSIGAVD